MTCHLGQEEVYSLWVWIRSFPQTSSISFEPNDDTADPTKYILNWLKTTEIARAILSVSQEICSTSSSHDPFYDDDSDKIWQEIDRRTGDNPNDSSFVSHNSDLISENKKMEYNLAEHCRILGALLCRAVSEECVRRQEYIGRILSLNASVQENESIIVSVMNVDVQMVLMKIIQDGQCIMSSDDKTLNPMQEDERDEDFSVYIADMCESRIESVQESEFVSVDSMKKKEGRRIGWQESFPEKESIENIAEKHNEHSGQRSAWILKDFEDKETNSFSVDEDNDKTFESVPSLMNQLEVEILQRQEENEEMEEQILRLREREEFLEAELEGLKTNYDLQMLRKESESIALIEHHEAEITKLREEIQQWSRRQRDFEDNKVKLQEMQDEIDLLQNSQTKLLYTEDQLKKCRAKLNDLHDVKDQLEREEEAHGKAVEQLLKLENELNQLQPLKRQLETYKTRATQAEVKLAECEHKLDQSRLHIEQLTRSNRDLTERTISHRCEAEDLRERLRQNEILCESDSVNGIGEGISELNPQLKAELSRLRNENSRLTEFAAQRTEDSVVKLQERLEDVQRIADKFKEQYFSTKSELETTQRDLASAKQIIANLEFDIEGWKENVASLESTLAHEKQQAEDERKAAKLKLEKTVHDLENKLENEIASMKVDYEIILNKERTHAKQKSLEAQARMEETISQHTEELKELRQKFEDEHSQQRSATEFKLKEMEDQHKIQIESERAEAKSELEALKQKGKGMLNSQKEKAAAELTEVRQDFEAEIVRINAAYNELSEREKTLRDKAKKRYESDKKKLKTASAKIIAYELHCEELQDAKEKLEKQLKNAKEENDKFRRQIGVRFAGDSNLESALEKLQSKYSEILEENRALKRQLTYAEEQTMVETVLAKEESFGPSSSSYAAPPSGSTLASLREECEEEIRVLKDENRELIMKNTACVSDLKKSEQRTWQLEEAVSKLKTELTTAKLAIERLEHQAESSTERAFPTLTSRIHSPEPDEAERYILHSTENLPPSEISIPKSPTKRDSPVKSIQPPGKRKKKHVPSLMEYTQLGSTSQVGTTGECKQS